MTAAAVGAGSGTPGTRTATMARRPRRGRAAAVPPSFYEAPPSVEWPDPHGSPVVRFVGDDTRSQTFVFGKLPLPGLHRDFAIALARRTGPGGSRRTDASAVGLFETYGRFVRALAELAKPPQRLEDLRVRHVERFRLIRLETCTARSAVTDVRQVFSLFDALPERSRLNSELAEFIGRRNYAVGLHVVGRPGYSDREFAAVMAAARSDVAAIRARISAGEQLLATYQRDSDALSDDERERARRLAKMATTGTVKVDYVASPITQYVSERKALAGQLFLLPADLAPLLVLGVGLTGRSPETIKELPAEHRLLEGQAVEMTLTKRRRGKGNARGTAAWEIARDPARQLRAPGSYYLLAHQLTRRSRGFSGTSSLWSIWVGVGRGAPLRAATAWHVGAFDAHLSRPVGLKEWAASHGITDDDGDPLDLRLTRMRKTVEARTAKAVGGHLPSARATNTADTSYTHYLRTDPFIQEWAAEVVTEAIQEAEAHARGVVLRILSPNASNGTLPVAQVNQRQLKRAQAGELDTLASACLDIEHHPDTMQRCQSSFLTCLRCPNALVLDRHLPALLALRNALQQELERRHIDTWVREHGRTWAVLTQGILPRFSPGQINAASVHLSREPAHMQAVLGLLEQLREPT